MEDEFIPVEHMVGLTQDYLGKRVSVKLKTGEIATGIVRWYDEDGHDEATGVPYDLGFVLGKADVNGKPVPPHTFFSIPDSQIVAYCPLEPANTDEEMIAMGL